MISHNSIFTYDLHCLFLLVGKLLNAHTRRMTENQGKRNTNTINNYNSQYSNDDYRFIQDISCLYGHYKNISIIRKILKKSSNKEGFILL
jgi:hypothetical protein